MGWLIRSVYPAKEEVRKAVQARSTVHPSGSIVVLETPVPWKEHLEELEKTMGLEKSIKFLLFPESEEKKAWRVQGIPENWGRKIQHQLKINSPRQFYLFI